MKRSPSLAAVFALAALAAAPSAQLPPGRYLAGTYGWTPTWGVDNNKNTVQVLDPYTGSSQMLPVVGWKWGEAPSSFIIEKPTSFLMGTKTLSAPAAGNVYRVQLQTNGCWLAAQLNTSPLPINVSSMVLHGGFIYVIGSAQFGRSADDAEIYSIASSNGVVALVVQLGAKYRTPGANGIGIALLAINGLLHAFTFDSRDYKANTVSNEHWTITTDGKTLVRLPDLPHSKRFVPYGYATSGALLDPATGNILVVGRWGELTWRTPAGLDVAYDAWPGPLPSDGSELDQCWCSVACNYDTWALAFGDYTNSVDERRSNGALFANNIITGWSSPGVMAISALAYHSSAGSYIPVGDGCMESGGKVCCSYLLGQPYAGNASFGLTLHTEATYAMLLLGSPIKPPVDLGQFGAPGCFLHVMPVLPGFPQIAANKQALQPMPLPPGLSITIDTQWFTLDPSANALGLVMSGARRLQI